MLVLVPVLVVGLGVGVAVEALVVAEGPVMKVLMTPSPAPSSIDIFAAKMLVVLHNVVVAAWTVRPGILKCAAKSLATAWSATLRSATSPGSGSGTGSGSPG